MARAAATDLLQNFRFHVSTIDFQTDVDPILFTGAPSGIGGEAGFQSVTIPEISVEAAEYREGTYKYTKKFPGPPTVTDCSMMRGIAKADTKFHDWIVATLSGGEYRCDLQIRQFARENIPATTDANEYSAIPGTAARIYRLFNCIPIRAKAGADLDATTGEVALGELDVAVEYFTIDTQ